MMLRASVEAEGSRADLRAITGGVDSAATQVPDGDALMAFAEAVVHGDEEAIGRARGELLERVGPAGFVDACGVVGNFERMVRIADSTGIPLDPPVAAITVEIREQLGIDAFESARNTPGSGCLARLFGRAGRAIGLAGIRIVGAIGRQRDRGSPPS